MCLEERNKTFGMKKIKKEKGEGGEIEVLKL